MKFRNSFVSTRRRHFAFRSTNFQIYSLNKFCGSRLSALKFNWPGRHIADEFVFLLLLRIFGFLSMKSNELWANTHFCLPETWIYIFVLEWLSWGDPVGFTLWLSLKTIYWESSTLLLSDIQTDRQSDTQTDTQRYRHRHRHRLRHTKILLIAFLAFVSITKHPLIVIYKI